MERYYGIYCIWTLFDAQEIYCPLNFECYAKTKVKTKPDPNKQKFTPPMGINTSCIITGILSIPITPLPGKVSMLIFSINIHVCDILKGMKENWLLG